MKFWQVSSIFREKEERKILYEIFSKYKEKNYLNSLENLDEIVRTQNRKILDEEIDEIILYELCALNKKVFYFSEKDNKIYSFSNIDAQEEISLLNAVKLFNHNCVEEVFEKTEAKAILR